MEITQRERNVPVGGLDLPKKKERDKDWKRVGRCEEEMDDRRLMVGSR